MPPARTHRAFVLLVVAIFFAPGRAGLQADPPVPAPVEWPALVRQAAETGVPRVVGITSIRDKHSDFYGTGSIITPDGYIITSTTVVPAGAEEIKVYFNGEKVYPAKLIESNNDLEATLIKIEGKDLPFFALSRETPAVGQRAFTFSNAHNLMQAGARASFSLGLVSGVYEVENLGGESCYHGPAIETSAAVNPGSDGGPIVNQRGQLCAILSLNFSPRRWQGVGIPMSQLLERMNTLKSGNLKLGFEPALPPAISGDFEAMAVRAQDMSNYLVAIAIQRKYPPEVLPRKTWDDYRRGIKDWDKLSVEAKGAKQNEYTALERLLEANQMVRRPTGPLTGVVISPDGHILSSAFNLGDEAVFKDKKTDKPRPVDFDTFAADLIKGAAKDLVIAKNPVEKISVTLPDGSQREAKLLARHEGLGVALLKIDAKDLKFLDMEKSAAQPELGTRVGIVGYAGGTLARYTLNVGIVGSTERDRGMRFQADALLNYGNSGGPVISPQGRLLGIALAPIKPQTVVGRVFTAQELAAWTTAPNSGVSMICRIDRLLPALGDLKAGKSFGERTGAVLGVGLDPRFALSDQLIIGQVMPDSGAKQAGLQAGDRIVKLDGVPLNSWKELTERISPRQPGSKVELEVFRKDIVRHLMINGQKVENEAELKALMQKLKPGEKFEGTMVQSDTRTVTVPLGEVK